MTVILTFFMRLPLFAGGPDSAALCAQVKEHADGKADARRQQPAKILVKQGEVPLCKADCALQVERFARDAKLLDIGAGTNEIRRMLIGRELIGAKPKVAQ